eukprot:110272_1
MSIRLVDKIDHIIAVMDCVDAHGLIVNECCPKSKRAIAAAHFFATILYDELNDKQYSCPFMQRNAHANLLDFLLIRGGATRDSLLNRPINDLDCIVDIHGISKYYLHHLQQYHSVKTQQSTNCPCRLWQTYLHKFTPQPSTILSDYMKDINAEDLEEKEQDRFFSIEHHIILSDCLLNARFFVKILLNSPLCKDKITARNFFFNHNWTIKISKSLMYNGIDLKGAELDLVDSTGKLGAHKELIQQITPMETTAERMDGEYEISIPIYPLSLAQTAVFNDFTLNGIMISWTDVLKPCKECVDFNWKYKIYTTIHKDHNMEGIKHLNEKLLVPPSLKIINEDTACFYFWRLVKVGAKFINEIEAGIWRIDDALMVRTIDGHNKWFDTKFIHDNDRRWHWLIYKFVVWGIKVNQDYDARLRMFKLLKFDFKLIDAMNQSGKFRKHWRYGIKSRISDEDRRQYINDTMVKYGYNLQPNPSHY